MVSKTRSAYAGIRFSAVLPVVLLLFSISASGAQTLDPCAPQANACQPEMNTTDENLNLLATDPLASFRQFQLRTNFNVSRWQRDSGSVDYEFRAIYPFRAWNRPNIFRVILPFSPEPEGSSALKDIELLDLAVFDHDWGQAGFGLGSTIATNPLDGDKDDFSLGPAAGFIVIPNKNFQWGFLNKNFITGDPTISTLQPILTYSLPDKWDIGLSSMIYTYDWDNGKLITAPLGFTVGKVFNAGCQPMRIFLESEYNFQNIADASRYRVLLGLSLLAGR